MSRKMKSGKGTSAPRKKVSKVLLTAAQIGKGELETLGKQIKAHVEKMRGYEARAQEKAGVELHKADNHRNTIAQLLAEAMAKCDSGGFKAFQEKYCPDLKRSRIYELLAIGSGKKTLEESRAEKRASVAKSRGKVSATSAPVADKSKVEPVKQTPLASGASGEVVGVTPEDQPPAPRVDKSDKPDIKRPVPKPKAPVEPVTASVSPAGREADPPASDTAAERELENEIFDLKAEIEELKAKNESLLRNHSGPSLAEALETALAYLNDLTHWRWLNDDQEGKRANASSTLANVVELVKPKDGSIPAYLMQQRGQLQ